MPVPRSFVRVADEKMADGRHARHDAHEDDERHAVADAALGDKLAHPHDEGGTGDQGEHDDDVRERLGHLRGELHTVGRRLEQQQVAHRVDEAETQRQVAGHLGDLTTARIPLASPASHGGDNALHQLHDDGCGDVGHDAEREHREVRQRATGEQVEHGHSHARVLEGRGKLMEGNARHRHVGTEAVQRKNSQGEEDLLAQLRNLECVND